MEQTFVLPALGSSPSFIMLLSGATGGIGHTFFISFRSSTGCDAFLDAQFYNKLDVHMYDGGTVNRAQAGPCLDPLAGSDSPQPNWSLTQLAAQVIITFKSQAGGQAVVGMCKYNSPYDCLGGASMT